jgi:SAM-dependent methyltransferase
MGSWIQRFRGSAEPPPEEPTSPGRGEFDGVAAHYDHLMRHVPYRKWVDYVEAILERRLARPQKVLDLCCGTGRVGSELLRRGYDVVGVDLSAPMARQCARQIPPLPAAVQDACELGLKSKQFDLIVCLYDSLNYILDPDRLQQCFHEAYRVLAPGGLFIFDMNTPRALKIGLFTQNNLGSPDPLQYSWKAHWIPDRRLCRVDMWFRWRADGKDEVYEETHWQYAYEKSDVLHMLAQAGFVAPSAFDAYSFRPASKRSDRIYYVVRKEQSQ